jgi:hypothetical protein
MVDERLAVWRYLPPLDLPRIEAWLAPIEHRLAAHLAARSDGSDLAASRVWSGWRTAGRVRQVEGTWVTGDPANDPLLALVIQGMVHIHREHADVAGMLLRYAAIAGETFSGDGVAAVVAADSTAFLEVIIGVLTEITHGCRRSLRWLTAPFAEARGARIPCGRVTASPHQKSPTS